MSLLFPLPTVQHPAGYHGYTGKNSLSSQLADVNNLNYDNSPGPFKTVISIEGVANLFVLKQPEVHASVL